MCVFVHYLLVHSRESSKLTTNTHTDMRALIVIDCVLTVCTIIGLEYLYMVHCTEITILHTELYI